MISGRHYWADGTPAAGQQFEYGLDDISKGKSADGRASAVSTYTVNDLHQYTQRTVAVDRNLTLDRRWVQVWEGENPLIEMRRDATSPAGAQKKLTFEYDWEGRRVRKTVCTGDGNANAMGPVQDSTGTASAHYAVSVPAVGMRSHLWWQADDMSLSNEWNVEWQLDRDSF